MDEEEGERMRMSGIDVRREAGKIGTMFRQCPRMDISMAWNSLQVVL